ncbi:MAG TPA: hypothetical protein VFQ82_02995 [Stellaceae bacterium]|nr:hypothetical protein [Stellaceae bacterium]
MLRVGALFEEQDDGLDAGTLEGAAGEVEDRMEVAAFEQHFAQADRGVVGVGEEGVFDRAAAAVGREQP